MESKILDLDVELKNYDILDVVIFDKAFHFCGFLNAALDSAELQVWDIEEIDDDIYLVTHSLETVKFDSSESPKERQDIFIRIAAKDHPRLDMWEYWRNVGHK